MKIETITMVLGVIILVTAFSYAVITYTEDAPETLLRGFCVDNDKDAEQYKFSYETQSNLFATSSCTFNGVRQDIMGCTGDDFYSFYCN